MVVAMVGRAVHMEVHVQVHFGAVDVAVAVDVVVHLVVVCSPLVVHSPLVVRNPLVVHAHLLFVIVVDALDIGALIAESSYLDKRPVEDELVEVVLMGAEVVDRAEELL